MVKRFRGSGRKQEGGAGATHKQDFNAHVTGGDWRHEANQVDVVPPVAGGSNVQSALENIATLAAEGSFVTIGDGYDSCADDFAKAFNDAFTKARLANGGVIIVKAGTYCMQTSVTVPNGITIRGEKGGVTIIGEMPEIPIFIFQTGTVKRDVQPGLIEQVQFADQNVLESVSLYDNVNGTVAGGAPSMTTVPMIQVQHGANLIVRDCSIVGRALTAPVRVTHRMLGFTGITSPGVGTTIHVENCYIDGVKTAVDFDGRQGDLDYLTVINNRARTFGDGGLGSTEDRFFVSMVECNATIDENYHVGLNTTWGAEGFVYIKDIVASNIDNLSISIDGNTGNLDTPGSNDLFVDARTTPSPLLRTTLSPWGAHNATYDDVSFGFNSNGGLGLYGATFVTDQSVIAQTGVVVGQDVVAAERLFINQSIIKEAQVIDLDDSMYSSGIVLNHPWHAFVRLVAGPSLTVSGDIVLEFLGEPLDSEELTIEVVQPESNGDQTTGRVLNLSLQTAGVGVPGFNTQSTTNTDYIAIDPHPNKITSISFRYNSSSGQFVKTSMSVSQNGDDSDFTWNYTSSMFDKPMMSRKVFKEPWQRSGQDSAGIFYTSNAVFMSRETAPYSSGTSMWFETSGGNAFLRYLTSGGSAKSLFLGSVTGTAQQMVIRDAESVSNAYIVIRSGNSIYGATLLLSAGSIGDISLSSFSLIGTATAGPIYHKFIDDFYYADGTDLYRINGNFGSGGVIANTPANIVDICRSPDGDFFALDFNGNYIYSNEGYDNTPVWNSGSFVFAGPSAGCSYDKINRRWIVYTSGGDVYHSTDIVASSWVLVGNVGFLTTNYRCQSVGNTLIATNYADNTAITTYSQDGAQNWSTFVSELGIPPESKAIGGFGYFNGYLLSPLYQDNSSKYIVSKTKVNTMGYADFDK